MRFTENLVSYTTASSTLQTEAQYAPVNLVQSNTNAALPLPFMMPLGALRYLKRFSMADHKRSAADVLCRKGGARPVARPNFDGTLACACRNLEGGVAAFVNFARAAQSNDPTLVQFLEAWDGLDPQAQEDPSQADALCRRLRLSPLEVLRAVVQEAV